MTAVSDPAPSLSLDRDAPAAAGDAIREPGPATLIALTLAFIACWTLYFAISEAPVAIKHDMSEAYAWGREFQLGYNQHPPFWAWICGLWFLIFPRTGWAFALLSAVNAGVGLYGVWMLTGNFAREAKRMASLALLLLMPVYTFAAYKYNANIIFLSLWPWTLHVFWRALQDRRLSDSLMFGVMAGLAVMSKYYAAILLLTCLAVVLQSPARRQYLWSASPYISAGVAALICAPHVWWLLTHQAPPLRYLASVSGQSSSAMWGYLSDTIIGALGMMLPAVAVTAILARTRPRVWSATVRKRWRDPTFRALVTVSLLPLALTLAAGVLLRTRLTPEMVIATFPLLPLLAIEASGITDIARLYRISSGLAVLLTLGAVVVSPVLALITCLSGRYASVSPFQEAAAEATRLWHDKTGRPVGFVAGSAWYDNGIAFYSPDRPHTFVRFDYPGNLWVTPERIAELGLMTVCEAADQPCQEATRAFLTPQSTATALSLTHHFLGFHAQPVAFVVTMIPPRS